MTDRDDVLDPADERRVAVSLFNATWPLLRRMDRSPEDDLRMLHMAHASRYHWERSASSCTWLGASGSAPCVYAVLGRPEPARFHAERSLQLCEIHGIGDFDLAYAHEALARGHRVAGDAGAAAAEATMARDLADGIADSDDREHFLSDLADLLP